MSGRHLDCPPRREAAQDRAKARRGDERYAIPGSLDSSGRGEMIRARSGDATERAAPVLETFLGEKCHCSRMFSTPPCALAVFQGGDGAKRGCATTPRVPCPRGARRSISMNHKTPGQGAADDSSLAGEKLLRARPRANLAWARAHLVLLPASCGRPDKEASVLPRD